MEKFTLIALTLFPATGIPGLNLQALNNTVGALLKVGSYALSAVWAVRLMNIYPGTITRILAAALFVGPWYLFDCMSILFNPDFPKEGFRPPVPIPGYPAAAPTDGRWLLTPSLLSLILAALPAAALGSTGILNSFAPGLVGGDVQKYIGAAAGSTAALGLAFSLFAANKAPTVGAGMAVPAAVPLQGGGGSGLPPLSAFAGDLMKSKSPQAYQESLAFMGVLGIVVAGGVALGLLRSHAADGPKSL